MSVNRDDLFLAIKKKTSYTREDLQKKLRKKNLHSNKKCETAIREILLENPKDIIKNVEGKCFISVNEILDSIQKEILTGKKEEITIRLMPERAKIEYKRFSLDDRESILSLIKHPDLPKSQDFYKNPMTRCFGCDWQSPNYYTKWDKQRMRREMENQLVNHYRNEILI